MKKPWHVEALRTDVDTAGSAGTGIVQITLLRIEGWEVNHKRVERIWRQEGLKVPRGRLWLNDGSCIRLRPLHKNHVWSYDFVSTRTHDGRALKLLTVLDEYTRQCLAIKVGRGTRLELTTFSRCSPMLLRSARSARASALGGPEFMVQMAGHSAPGTVGERHESFNG